MQISMRPLTELKVNNRNARTHPPAQIKKLARAIREFGFRVPILVDETGIIVAGHVVFPPP